MTHRFRAIWPITGPRLPLADLIDQAIQDLPALVAQAHARVLGPARWSVALSTEVPGSGRVTEWVLIYEAPATRTTRCTTQPTQEASTAA